MSEQLPVVPDTPSPHPIHLVVTDDLRRSRLTVFFRILLAVPHFVWLVLWGLAVWFAVLAAWLIGVFSGRVPEGLHGFIASFLRYLTHVSAYYSLAANPYPSFTGAPGYPIDVEIAQPTRQSRLTIFFRLPLVIPAYVVLYVLGIVANVVMILAWFYSLVAGRLNGGLRDVLAYWLRYNVQTIGYLSLLTQRYPSFAEE